MASPVAAAKDLLARLVAFDTTSHKSNLPIIRFVEDYLRRHGVESTLVPTPDGEKASLFATIGPTGVGGIALSGHTDVVPVEGQSWSSDPFTLVERDGRLYGRGACDMKAYLACVLAMVPELKARNLTTPVHIAFSYDEEVGCTGVRPMIAELGSRLPLPRMVLVGEPTTMTVVDAHKGPMRWVVRLTGKAAHSSMPHLGVNAITYAGRLLGELARIETELKEASVDPRFEPPYTTLQVTQLAGGNASNIVPAACWFGWEIRRLPGFDGEALDARFRRFAEQQCTAPMRQADPEAGVGIELVNEVPPFQADAGAPIVPLALKLAQQNETFAVCYATEASLFQGGGAPAVVCGPGDIAQAHTPDEFIEVAELEKCLAFLGRLADWAEAG
ncbi:MAG TPA: acetylornithine deacetylase [Hyphomicrobiaceae bacterium]|jgi:acetylornithine deacetylase|nr:acetylornithine deacetylase [Hyphomicrobiaceae bacterium]